MYSFNILLKCRKVHSLVWDGKRLILLSIFFWNAVLITVVACTLFYLLSIFFWNADAYLWECISLKTESFNILLKCRYSCSRSVSLSPASLSIFFWNAERSYFTYMSHSRWLSIYFWNAEYKKASSVPRAGWSFQYSFEMQVATLLGTRSRIPRLSIFFWNAGEETLKNLGERNTLSFNILLKCRFRGWSTVLPWSRGLSIFFWNAGNREKNIPAPV